MLDRMTKVLEQALRSDYPHFIAGEDCCASGSRRCSRWPRAATSSPTISPNCSAAPTQMPTETLAQAAARGGRPAEP